MVKTAGLNIPMDYTPRVLDDDLCLVLDDDGAYFCVTLRAVLFFENGRTKEMRLRVADVLDLYREAVGDVFTFGWNPKTLKFRKMKDKSWLDIRSWLPRLGPHDDFQPGYMDGLKVDDAPSHRFHACSCPDWAPEELSYLTFSVPVAWASNRPESAYRDLVLEACNRLGPTHGYAGLGFELPTGDYGDGGGSREAFKLLPRYRGISFEIPFRDTEPLTKENKIRTVNWLTVLADPWIERLGGKEALSEKLGPGIDIHAFDGGLVIQAGPVPRFGDVNRMEPMDPYEQVAKALKDIRIKELPAFGPHGAFGRERVAEWLARFDKKPWA